jgi:hypothetical protein
MTNPLDSTTISDLPNDSEASLLKNLANQVKMLQETQKTHKVLIENLEEVIKARELEIKFLEYTIKANEIALQNYYNSNAWKALSGFYKTANRFLPLDSKRRKMAKKVFSVFWR